MVGRFATIALAAATAIGAGPTTLGLVLADSPPVTLAAASTPTTGWTWKAAGDEQGGGGDSAGSDSSGDSGGDTNVAGNPDGGESGSGESGSGGAPDVEGKGSDKSDTDGGGEKGPDVETGAKDTTAEDDGESGSAVGTDPEKREPTGESGEGTTNTQVSGGAPTQRNPHGTQTASGLTQGVLPPSQIQEAGWKQEVLEKKGMVKQGPLLPPGTPKNPNEWDMEPTAKDYAFGGIGGTAAASERVYQDAYRIDPLSDEERTKRGQKVSDKLAEAKSDRLFYNRLMERDSNPSFREYYRTKAFEAGENATKYQRQLDAMGAPKQALTNISDPEWFKQKINSGAANTALTGSQASEALAEYGPAGEKLGPKVADTALAAGAKTVNAAEGLSPKLAAVGNVLAEDVKTLGKAAPIVGWGATAVQAGMDLWDGKSVGRVAQETGGSVAGGIAGGALGGAIGTALLPGIGTAAGVALGNAVGSWLGGKAGSWLADQTMDEGK